MNLKQAAHELGVHYQTAYKWVRSGDLVAVRIGTRYEISEAAIARYRATRQAVGNDAVRTPSPESAASPTELMRGLEELSRRPFLDLDHALNHVARRLARTTGDMCLLALIGAASKRIESTVGFEADPITIPVQSMVPVLVSRTRLVEDAPLLGAVLDQGTLRVPHLAQDVLRDAVPPEFHQYLDEWRVFSVVAAAITDDDAQLGAIALLRDRPERPFDATAEAWMRDIGGLVGRIVHRAQEDEETRRARDQVRLALAAYGTDAPDDPSLRGLLEVETVAIAVHRTDGLLVANTAFRVRDATEPERGALTAMLSGPVPARLASGELDYLDEVVDGWVLHHATVRAPDAGIRYVVTAVRPIGDADGA